MKRILMTITALFLLAIIAYSGHQLWIIRKNTVQEAQMHEQLIQYRPQLPLTISESADSTSREVNPSIAALKTKYPDAVGWLTIANTNIDYPFVQGTDNEHYLHLDIDQSSAAAGTIFMDHRNQQDFSDFNTILYGHHMKSGSMFATIQKFDQQAFFDANRFGIIFLEHKAYEIEFIAFGVIAADDAIIYGPTMTETTDKITFFDHIERTARHYRDIGVTEDDRMVTLSTCNYEFHDARMVLIGRLIEM